MKIGPDKFYFEHGAAPAQQGEDPSCEIRPCTQSAQGMRKVIVFGLMCHSGHEFEGWFRSASDFDDQVAMNALDCPACGSPHIDKTILAPNLSAFRTEGSFQRPYGTDTDLTDNTETIASLEAEIANMRRQIKEELRDFADAGHTMPDACENELDLLPEAQVDGWSLSTAEAFTSLDLSIFDEISPEGLAAFMDEGLSNAPLTQNPDLRRKKLN